jgi:recombination protein RecT
VIQQESYFRKSGDSVSWEKESQFAIQQLTKNEFLKGVAQKNLASLQNAIINVSAIGISLNPANRHAYLVPRDGMVCLDISYMGLMHLAIQGGAIEWGQAKIVHENDTYENNGIDKAPSHKQNTFGDKGKIVGVYCTVKLKSGDYLTEEMDIEAINKVKSTSKSLTGNGAKYSPWNTFPAEMMRKTVVKRASKYWPVCDKLNKAVEVLNEHEGLSEEYEKDITSPPIESYTKEQKEFYDNLISTSDSIGMAMLQIRVDESIFMDLYHSFNRGEKGKYQTIVNGLVREGKNLIEKYAQGLNDAAGDDSACIEMMEEIGSKSAINYILSNRCDSETEMHLRKLLPELNFE